MFFINIIYLIIVVFLIGISIYDAYTKKIPNWCIAILFCLSLYIDMFCNFTYSSYFQNKSFIGLCIWWIFSLSWLYFGEFILGSGDFKLIIAIWFSTVSNYGLFLEWLAIFYIVQLIWQQMFVQIMKKDIKVPFGYLITIAYIFAICNIHGFIY